jgi:thymidylate synthase (FAD)
MKVSDISVTLLDHSGSDLSVVNAARVSFAKESAYEEYDDLFIGDIQQQLSEKDQKLIAYLAKHRHKSPFNHAFMSFRVKAPIFVARQLVKHEYLPWNEVSRRYVTDEPEFYFPDVWRKAADNVKQGSSDESVKWLYENEPYFPNLTVDDVVQDVTYTALENYKNMLKVGVCPEQARMVLPQNMMTEWIWSGTLYAFAKMCVLRLDSHTQKETREVAEQVSKFAIEKFPVSWKYLVEHKHAI